MLELLVTASCATVLANCTTGGEFGNMHTDHMINSNSQYQHLQSFSTQMAPSTVQKSAMYRVIHKLLQDFRPLRYRSRDGHAEGEHVNRGRDTPSFCPTLLVLDMFTLGDMADVNPVIKFLPHTLQHLAVNSSDCLHDPSSQLW
jgi:hypothetical protein